MCRVGGDGIFDYSSSLCPLFRSNSRLDIGCHGCLVCLRGEWSRNSARTGGPAGYGAQSIWRGERTCWSYDAVVNAGEDAKAVSLAGRLVVQDVGRLLVRESVAGMGHNGGQGN